jgi:hypothetical protein
MIKAYVGLPGTGKTLNMVYDLMDEMVAGKRVISNTPIMFKHLGKEYQAEYVSRPKEFERKIITERNCTIAIDEASIFFPSQFWNKMTGEFIMKFAQTRKYGCNISYTSQGYKHTVKRLRDLTNLVGKCSVGRFLKWRFYNLTWFDPEYYEFGTMSAQREKSYILDTRTIFPVKFQKIIAAYQTLHTVEGSALAEIPMYSEKEQFSSEFLS